VFRSRQWPEHNWASVVRTDRGSRLSSGEISGGEAPRTLLGNCYYKERDAIFCLCYVNWFVSRFECVCAYRVRQFQGDLIAGIAVGLTVVPQSLAYAKIAELPPQVSLSNKHFAVSPPWSNKKDVIFSQSYLASYCCLSVCLCLWQSVLWLYDTSYSKPVFQPWSAVM